MDTTTPPDGAAEAPARSPPAEAAAKLRRRVAAALAARDRVVDRWLASERRLREGRAKQVCYLSLEFLPGPLLPDALGNLGLTDAMRAALAGLGVDLDRVLAQEPD